MAVGGFVVGASAMAALLGLHDVLQRDESISLRGSPYYPDSTEATTSSGAPLLQGRVSNDEPAFESDLNFSQSGTNLTASTQAPSYNQGSTPSPTPSPSSPYPTYEPTQKLDTLMPTYQPSTAGEFPTELPTALGQFPTELPTTQDNEVSALRVIPKNSFLRSKEVGVRLKLYWEEGYYWQERTDERW